MSATTPGDRADPSNIRRERLALIFERGRVSEEIEKSTRTYYGYDLNKLKEELDKLEQLNVEYLRVTKNNFGKAFKTERVRSEATGKMIVDRQVMYDALPLENDEFFKDKSINNQITRSKIMYEQLKALREIYKWKLGFYEGNETAPPPLVDDPLRQTARIDKEMRYLENNKNSDIGNKTQKFLQRRNEYNVARKTIPTILFAVTGIAILAAIVTAVVTVFAPVLLPLAAATAIGYGLAAVVGTAVAVGGITAAVKNAQATAAADDLREAVGGSDNTVLKEDLILPRTTKTGTVQVEEPKTIQRWEVESPAVLMFSDPPASSVVIRFPLNTSLMENQDKLDKILIDADTQFPNETVLMLTDDKGPYLVYFDRDIQKLGEFTTAVKKMSEEANIKNVSCEITLPNYKDKAIALAVLNSEFLTNAPQAVPLEKVEYGTGNNKGSIQTDEIEALKMREKPSSPSDSPKPKRDTGP